MILMNYVPTQSDNIEISSISTSSDSERDEDVGTYRNKISSYEAAAIKKREENQMLLKRLLKVAHAVYWCS